jgi:capsule polysaccharide modification protein KpsS
MRYRDTWTKHIPQEKLEAYKCLLEESIINDVHVLYVRKSKITVVEYDSNLSRPELTETMRGISEKVKRR